MTRCRPGRRSLPPAGRAGKFTGTAVVDPLPPGGLVGVHPCQAPLPAEHPGGKSVHRAGPDPVPFTAGTGEGYRKQYARIAAGEFIRANMTKRQRIVRDLSWPVAIILLAVFIVFFARRGMFGQILGFMLGLSLIGWVTYGITILWERRHHTTLIAERGSMYTLDTATEGERV